MVKMYKGSVLIAGAGPAGIAASLVLCKHKIHHVLVEKSNFPKDKICGDALSGKVLDTLKRIDEDLLNKFLIADIARMPSYGVTFVAPNGKALDVPFAPDVDSLKYPPGFISQRTHFDYWLFSQIDRQYCQYLHHIVFKQVQRSGSQLQVHLQNENGLVELTTNLVIGAEGERSVVAKQLAGRVKSKKEYSAGLRCYYQGVEGLSTRGFIELHFLKELVPGYFWIFPLPNGMANVGLGVPSPIVSSRRLNLRELLFSIVKIHPQLSSRFKNAYPLEEPKGWGLPLGGAKTPLHGDNYLLTGDAASLIDPFTGEGIGNAMLSGWLAGSQARLSVEANRFNSDFLQPYTQGVYHKLGSELHLSKRLQQLAGYPWLFNFLISKATKNEALRQTITAMFTDVNTRAKLKDPRFYFKLLFN
jgi:geranylgeranyl reductase family protein